MYLVFKNQHHNNLLFALFSGVLLSLSWPPIVYPFLVFIAFVPLLLALISGLQLKLSVIKTFIYPIVTFSVFNFITTWWVGNASILGVVVAIMLNTTLMSLPVWWFIKRFNQGKGYSWIGLVCSWLAVEWFHSNWDLHWPWLMLGNVFANQPWLVNWYQYTGVLGGSCWIWWFNIGLTQVILHKNNLSKPIFYRQLFNLFFFRFFAVVLFSIYVSSEYNKTINQTKRLSASIVAVQPNIDPYHDKFEGQNPYEQTKILLALADSLMDDSVQCVVFPETALVGSLNEMQLEHEDPIKLIRNFLQKHPHTAVITGAESFKTFLPNETLSETAREYNPGQFYDAYNTALCVKFNDTVIDVYHKSKLVPGVEQLPFAAILKPISWLTINLGGTTGSLGKSPEPVVFKLNSMLKIAPIICYESVFGAYIGKYINKGATLLCVITNDGWWGNTAGYKQHLAYARLRAIETRRYLVRSANTGISAFVDDNGNIMSQTDWWKPAAIKQKVYLNQEQTFYAKHGDWVGKVAFAFCLLMIVVNVVGISKKVSH